MASPDPLATMREQLAAAQANERELREAIAGCVKYANRRESEWCERAERAFEFLYAALSRAPGSDDALREMLAWAVSEGARAGEEGARTGRSETNESIVSRILGPEGGKA